MKTKLEQETGLEATAIVTTYLAALKNDKGQTVWMCSHAHLTRRQAKECATYKLIKLRREIS